MSDTPRTNAEAFFPHDSKYKVCDADFCRQLERELNAANESFRKLNIHALDLAARIKRLEEALVKITKEVPAHDGCGGLFRPMFDVDGNEIGVKPVDPIKVIGAMHARALDALERCTHAS